MANKNGQISKDTDSRTLFRYVQEADQRAAELAEVKQVALRLLSQQLGERKSFVHDGVHYQIRERGGEPYLVRLSRDIPSL